MRIRHLYLFTLIFLSTPAWAQQTTAAQAPATHKPDQPAPAHPAYFIDGYHGGVYGHIPQWQTKFMVEKLKEFPDWKINLELEPESWDSIELEHPEDYTAFRSCIADQSSNGRVEYINPAYGQSYLYDIEGESIIRQFYYGIRKLRQHFPNLVFSTYSSEEPCFTSALPQILRSYGFKYASLKNPNTCWGGYTRAHGGELVNWIGPDGTSILTVPRYATEALKPHSTWETIAENNSLAYVLSAFKAGITNPVGMTLQDAGWEFGPWIKPGEAYKPGSADEDAKNVKQSYHPTIYETWRGYIEHHTPGKTSADWHFSQEDVLTSLVWGGQVLSEVAQNVRQTEGETIVAEKLASIAAVYKGTPWPGESLDEAWRELLLSQHHDCWIVPYNTLRGTDLTWAENVQRWTSDARGKDLNVMFSSMDHLLPASMDTVHETITLFNPTAVDRDEYREIGELPNGWAAEVVHDADGKLVPSQAAAYRRWLIRAKVPALGYTTYRLEPGHRDTVEMRPVADTAAIGAHVFLRNGTTCVLETDRYKMTLDLAHGGRITHLLMKGKDAKDFVDSKALHDFGELRGNFYQDGGFRSSTETPVQVYVLENGPYRIEVGLEGKIAGTTFVQNIRMEQGEPKIDFVLDLNWDHDQKIGESPDSIKGYPLRKEFYNDSFKLQALFPLALTSQKVYRNAPFDVFQSRLTHTFFNSWDSIKNVILLNWVDVEDGDGKYGMALFSDRTTSYSHGAGYPLALTLQYSGPGLFGRDYSITRGSIIHYALVPHKGTWEQAGIWTENTKWEQGLMSWGKAGIASIPKGRSLLRLAKPGWEVSSITVSGKDLLVRLFHAEGKDSIQRILPNFFYKRASLVELDGRVVRSLDSSAQGIVLSAPRFGIRTIQFKDVIK